MGGEGAGSAHALGGLGGAGVVGAVVVAAMGGVVRRIIKTTNNNDRGIEEGGWSMVGLTWRWLGLRSICMSSRVRSRRRADGELVVRMGRGICCLVVYCVMCNVCC